MNRLTVDRLALAGALLLGGAVAYWSGARGFVPSFLFGAAGLAAVHQRLRDEFSAATALTASLVLLAGTSLPWVMTHDPRPFDTAAFAIVAVLFWASDRKNAPRLPLVAALVAAAAAPPVLAWVESAFGPTGSTTAAAQESRLFSSSRGLLSLTPIVYAAVIGAILYVRRNRRAALAGLAALVFWLAVDVLIPLSRDSHAYFAHGLTPALAVVAPGLGVLIDFARARPLVALGPLVAAFVLWNYLLMVQYTVGVLPKDAPVSFAAMVRQQGDVHTRAPYRYLFALPASAWFAWRQGLPVERYDVLAGEPLRDRLDMAFEAGIDRFLLEGWEPIGSGATTSGRWTEANRATIAVPLALPASRDITVSMTARTRLEDPAVAATIGVAVNGREIGRVVVPPQAPTDLELTVPADVGPLWRRGYNRLTFVSHGVQRIDPSDQRPPGPLGRRPGSVWPVALYRLRIAPR